MQCGRLLQVHVALSGGRPFAKHPRIEEATAGELNNLEEKLAEVIGAARAGAEPRRAPVPQLREK